MKMSKSQQLFIDSKHKITNLVSAYAGGKTEAMLEKIVEVAGAADGRYIAIICPFPMVTSDLLLPRLKVKYKHKHKLRFRKDTPNYSDLASSVYLDFGDSESGSRVFITTDAHCISALPIFGYVFIDDVDCILNYAFDDNYLKGKTKYWITGVPVHGSPSHKIACLNHPRINTINMPLYENCNIPPGYLEDLRKGIPSIDDNFIEGRF